MRPGIFMPKFARKGNRMRQFIVASHGTVKILSQIDLAVLGPVLF